MMELKGRLKLITELIPESSLLCDVGTDHAYIPIYALKNGICPRAVAADVRVGPVKIATRNVARYRLEDRIEVRLGGGLQPLRTEELDTVIIAGMGGLLITEILEESIEKAHQVKYFILQPMNAIEVVRSYLNGNGFEILQERLAAEEDKIYNVICTRWTGKSKIVDDFDNYIGDKLVEGNDENLPEYLQKRLSQLDTAIAGMEKAKDEPDSLEEYRKIRNKVLAVMANVKHEQGSNL